MTDSVRQSVTIPGELAREIERGAKRQHETFSKSMLRYVRLGIAEEQRAQERLRDVVRKIRSAPTTEEAETFTNELTEAIFGPQRRKPETQGFSAMLAGQEYAVTHVAGHGYGTTHAAKKRAKRISLKRPKRG